MLSRDSDRRRERLSYIVAVTAHVTLRLSFTK